MTIRFTFRPFDAGVSRIGRLYHLQGENEPAIENLDTQNPTYSQPSQEGEGGAHP